MPVPKNKTIPINSLKFLSVSKILPNEVVGAALADGVAGKGAGVLDDIT
jgi:hypothetical protein